MKTIKYIGIFILFITVTGLYSCDSRVTKVDNNTSGDSISGSVNASDDNEPTQIEDIEDIENFDQYFSDDFESYEEGESLSSDNPFGAAGRTRASTEQSNSGSQSAKMEIKPEDEGGFGQWGGTLDVEPEIGKGGEVWVKLQVYWPSSFDFTMEEGGGRMKFLRLHNKTADGSNGGYNDLYVDNPNSTNKVLSTIKERHNEWKSYNGPALPRDTWETYEMYLSVDDKSVDEGGEARFRVWRDGELIFNRTDVPTITDAGGVIDSFFLFTYWNGENPANNHLYVDDVVLATRTERPDSTGGNPNPEGLLFEDDFSSGDLSKHNDNFRWGRSGNIKEPTGESSQIITAEGPDGSSSEMMKFDYPAGSNWSETRFHLTESIDEKRSENGLSDVAYPELWVRFWMRIPDNYYHGLYDEEGKEHNNAKGWIYLWNGGYETEGPPSVANRFAWWPETGSESVLGNSTVTVEKKFLGGHDRTPNYIHPAEQIPSDPERAWAITKEERGQWIDYAFHFRLASGPDQSDGVIEVYKNGELAMSWTTNSWPRDGSSDRAGFDRGYLMGYQNSIHNERQIYYLDDFRIGTTAESVGLDESGNPTGSTDASENFTGW